MASSTEYPPSWRYAEHISRWVAEGLVEPSAWRGDALIRTPDPGELATGAFFDVSAVEKVLKFFLLLKQFEGRHAGREFRLLDWQVEFLIAPLFGWRYRDDHPDAELAGTRVVREVWFEIPRKNGKSTLCGGLSLYLLMADGEAAAQVYAAAGDREQANNVFRPARTMAESSKAILKKLGGPKAIQRRLIVHPNGNFLRVLPSDGGRQHGLNPHGAVIDEVHVHKNPDLVEALESATGARLQPVVIYITTADDGDETSIYNRKREFCERVASGTVKASGFLGVVFGADETADGFDPHSEETQRAANPGFGSTLTKRFLADESIKARESPAQLGQYLRLHLNIRTKQHTRWIPLERWDGTAQLISDGEWQGRMACGGLDLSSTSDMTAFSFVSADASGRPMVHRLFWIPEEKAADLERRHAIPFSEWAAAGWVNLTEGNVVDYQAVRDKIVATRDRLGVSMIDSGYDPWNATETVQQLERDGWAMVPIRQGYASMSPPCKEYERLILGSTPSEPLIRTGGSPVMRWMIDCVEVIEDGNGNMRPVKPDRRSSSKRIDGVVSDLMALDRWVRHEEQPGYEVVGF